MPSTSALESDLQDWIDKQPIWLQYAAQHLVDRDVATVTRIEQYAKDALSEVDGQLEKPPEGLLVSSYGVHGGGRVSLTSLSGLSGIGRLNPRKPLSFGETPLAIVFGPNAAGKSSYVRLLKHICGARDKGVIHGNIYEDKEVPQGCTIAFTDGAQNHSIEWLLKSGISDQLSTVDIFDAHCGHSYLISEGTLSYEPPALQLLSELAAISDKVTQQLVGIANLRSSSLPLLPSEHAATEGGLWYKKLTAKTEAKKVEDNCYWSADDETSLTDLTKELTERSPSERAKELREKKRFCDDITMSLADHIDMLSDNAFELLQQLRKEVVVCQKAAELAAKVSIDGSELEGVGSPEWLLLWSHARKYSTKTAYPDSSFPNTTKGSRCVMCHQVLDAEAQKRLIAFENYITDQTSIAASEAKQKLQESIDSLQDLPSEALLDARITSSGLTAEAGDSLKTFYKELLSRIDHFRASSPEGSIPPLPSTTTSWLASARDLSQGYEKNAKALVEGFNSEERAKKIKRSNELSARKWLAVQKPAIETEIERLKEISRINRAKDLCNTRNISLKKGTVAEQVITPAYVDAFNRELHRLGARRVQVTMGRTRVERGAILHQLKLRDSVKHRDIDQVLSDGERRIVCLAAFLADTASNPNESTFIFDDPISSLDLEYEEAVVQRLIEVSKTRQVVVFTHRLSMLGMMQDYAKKADIADTVVHIRSEPWGAGEPGEELVDSAPPRRLINDTLPGYLREANAIFNEKGWHAYTPYGQSLCTNIRKTIERLIEIELLGDVIQRHRRAINTQGKIDKLTNITSEDCRIADDLMTKYSRYEHAQSVEAPVTLPEPAELEQDLATLKKWRDAIEHRRKKPLNQ